MSINLDYYKIFYNVAKYGKIATVAEKMYISQPAITQTVKKLEEQLSSKLFIRTKYGMELTYEGKALYEYLKKSIENLENAESFFSNYNNFENGEIRIGSGRNFIEYFIMPAFKEFIEKYPNINFSLRNVERSERITKVINGEIDLSVIDSIKDTSEFSNIEITKLGDYNKYLFFASKKYLKENKIKSIKDMEKCMIFYPYSKPLIEMINKFEKKNKLKFEHKQEVDVSSHLFEMVSEDIGIGFTGKIYYEHDALKEDFEIIDEFKDTTSNIYLVSLKKEMCNKAVLEFINCIKEKNS